MAAPQTNSNMRIILDKPPAFYSNLDTVAGRVLLFVHRSEPIGAIIVKLEGEAKTYAADEREPHGRVVENHKILYQVSQVFPHPNSAPATPSVLHPGPHQFAFRLKIPFNTACSDIKAMAKMSGGMGMPGMM